MFKISNMIEVIRALLEDPWVLNLPPLNSGLEGRQLALAVFPKILLVHVRTK